VGVASIRGCRHILTAGTAGLAGDSASAVLIAAAMFEGRIAARRALREYPAASFAGRKRPGCGGSSASRRIPSLYARPCSRIPRRWSASASAALGLVAAMVFHVEWADGCGPRSRSGVLLVGIAGVLANEDAQPDPPVRRFAPAGWLEEIRRLPRRRRTASSTFHDGRGRCISGPHSNSRGADDLRSTPTCTSRARWPRTRSAKLTAGDAKRPNAADRLRSTSAPAVE